MKDQFVTYEIALHMKELGFDKKVLTFYLSGEFNWYDSTNKGFGKPLSDIVNAPLWQQAIDWLREKYMIFVHIEPEHEIYGILNYYRVQIVVNGDWQKLDEEFNKFTEAREAAILKALDLIKLT